jgi:hypothetical protein
MTPVNNCSLSAWAGTVGLMITVLPLPLPNFLIAMFILSFVAQIIGLLVYQ